MKEMSKYDLTSQKNKSIFLSDLKPGNKFLLAGREFEKGKRDEPEYYVWKLNLAENS